MALNLVSNFAANVAHRNLLNTDEMATSSLAKLSAGTRVISARDDAASLAIGSRLRAEVAALQQASVNAGQASSLLQIADGALATTADILVRMKSLSVQASSGQLGSTERAVLNTEFTALKAEIDRIANDTEFNGLQLIAGSQAVAHSLTTASTSNDPTADGISTVKFEDTVADLTAFRYSYDSSTETFTMTNATTGATQIVDITATLDAVAAAAGRAAGTDLVAGETADVVFASLGVTFTLTGSGGSPFARGTSLAPATITETGDAFTAANVTFTNQTTSVTEPAIDALNALVTTNSHQYDSSTGLLTIAFTNVGTTANTVSLNDATGSGLKFSIDGTTTAVADLSGSSFTDTSGFGANGINVFVTVGTADILLGNISLATLTSAGASTAHTLVIDVGDGLIGDDSTVTGTTATNFDFKLGTGVTTNVDTVTFSLTAASTSVLAISTNTIDTVNNANLASTAVSSAIDTLNTARAGIGAAQNRLSFAAANLATSIENAEAARSGLLDLDVASEITNFTSRQVLLQAGVAMLAQANQLPQNLLQLLQ